MKWLYLILLLLSLLAVGCVEIKYRPQPGLGTECEANAECSAQAPVCDANGSGTCVQCLPSVPESCGGSTPVCGMDNACHACSAHADCASDACLPDGSCAAEEDVVYVRQGGAGAGACTQSAPCGDFGAAVDKVSAKRQYLRISGTLTNNNSDDEGQQSFTILGEPGAILRNTVPRPLLDLRRGGTVEIYDLVMNPLEMGANIENGSQLILHRSKISGGRSEAILIRNGSATILQSEISESGGNGRRGISLQNGELTIDRSKISSNLGGGIVVSGNQRFLITNSFIVSNSGGGGLQISRPGAGSKLEFNTIVDNRNSGTNFSDVGGIFCDDSNFLFANNLIFRNSGGLTGIVQTLGACRYGNSFINAGNGSGDSSLGFRSNVAPFDYHLTAGSPASVRDAAGTCTGMDYDGDSRAGILCDLGADEVQ